MISPSIEWSPIGKARGTRLTPKRGDIPRLMSGRAGQRLKPPAAGAIWTTSAVFEGGEFAWCGDLGKSGKRYFLKFSIPYLSKRVYIATEKW